MTPAEKKLRRRELNRLAAQRSRQKKRSVATKHQQVTIFNNILIYRRCNDSVNSVNIIK